MNSSVTSPQVKYTRLPGRSMGLATRASLWLGPDHLLLVHETMTGENYRRFFFRDIQAIVVRATNRRAKVGLILGLLGIINLLPLLALGSDLRADRGIAWFALGSVGWALLVVVNAARGPTCETRIRTGLQEDVVPPLSRRRAVDRVILRVRPLLLAAQAPESTEGHAP